MRTMAVVSLFIFTGCATEFMGSPHVNRASCEKYCRDTGLEFSGMVALGEYSSGCICTVVKNSKNACVEAGAGAADSAAAVMSAIRARRATASIMGGSAAHLH